jgi:hypothetical protein
MLWGVFSVKFYYKMLAKEASFFLAACWGQAVVQEESSPVHCVVSCTFVPKRSPSTRRYKVLVLFHQPDKIPP